MRRRELQLAVEEEFGSLGGALMADLSLGPLGGRTATQALDGGVPAREVWQALCEAKDVPVERRHGRGLCDPH